MFTLVFPFWILTFVEVTRSLIVNSSYTSMFFLTSIFAFLSFSVSIGFLVVVVVVVVGFLVVVVVEVVVSEGVVVTSDVVVLVSVSEVVVSDEVVVVVSEFVVDVVVVVVCVSESVEDVVVVVVVADDVVVVVLSELDELLSELPQLASNNADIRRIIYVFFKVISPFVYSIISPFIGKHNKKRAGNLRRQLLSELKVF